MKITGVTVDGVGRFGATSRLTGFGEGVNILAAGNEIGKSTFFKAIRACLFDRHTTKNDAVQNLSTDGLSLPVTVTLEFDHGGHAYSLRKSFIKSPAATLLRDSVEIARGREADESVWDILGVAQGNGRSIDDAAFGILWVGQGQSFRVPQPSEAATVTLNAAIHQEVGTLVGGERARQILNTIKTDLARQITDSGKPKAGGALSEATIQLAAVAEELKTAQHKYTGLDQHLEDLDKFRLNRKSLADPEVMLTMSSDLKEARSTLKSGEMAFSLLKQCEIDEQHAHAQLEIQRRQFVELQKRGQRIDQNRTRYREYQGALAPLDERETEASSRIVTASAEISELSRKDEAQDEQERILQRISNTIDRLATYDGLIQRLQALTEFNERLTRNDTALKSNKVTKKVTDSLDLFERELGNLTSRLEAGASRVTIEFPVSTSPITLDGKILETITTRPVVEHMTIVVGEIAKITISPPVESLATAHSKRQEFTNRLKQLLDGCGASNAIEARNTYAFRQALEADAQGLKAERKALGLDDVILSVEVARLQAAIEGISADMTQTLADLKLEDLPKKEFLDQQRNEFAQLRISDRQKRVELDAIIDAHNKTLGSIANDRGQLRGTMAEVQSQLDTDLATLPDADRQKLLNEAEEACQKKMAEHRSKSTFLEEKRNETPSADELQRRETRVKRLESAIENQKSSLSKLDQSIAHLEGQIQTEGGDGLGERLAELSEQHEIVRREFDRQTSRVETLKLLKEVIEKNYNNRREQLNAPLRRHLQPFLNDVFPTAEIELGEGYAINGIKRFGPSSENFEKLSAGTQEQIAVLVRLAMGAMISERGQNVPIILDDALVFSDDDRIEQMFDALTRAGQKQQVIVLTCRSRTFAALGGHKLSITTNLTL